MMNDLLNSNKAFCAAKWLQVTIDLEKGTTQSCHHPERHKIPLEELHLNESALHNTNFKKQQRKLMLKGVRPEECSYCWQVEDKSGSNYSDRAIKNADEWASPYIEKIKNLPWDENVLPTYLEVMLDSICNLSCAYCYADISSTIKSEMLKYGKYPLLYGYDHRSQRILKDDNSAIYFQKFQAWLPKILRGLHVFRITGGEPILSNKIDKIVELIGENGTEKLQLIINTNLSYNSNRLKEFVSRVVEIKKNKKSKSVSFYVSIDTVGVGACYIRNGLEEELFRTNLSLLLENNEIEQVVVMCTFNILSIPNFHEFLKWIADLKIRYGVKLGLDIAVLKDPIYLSPILATKELVAKTEDCVRWMINSLIFNEHEIKKLERIVGLIRFQHNAESINVSRAQFYFFINEFDRRKGTCFVSAFPELKEFYALCKKAALFEGRASL